MEDNTTELDRRGFLIHDLLDMGEGMLLCGAEVHRVEDTLTRMGLAYGAKEMNVFVITSLVCITAVFEDHDDLTSTRRIKDPCGNDFHRLEEYNALSRSYCAQQFDLKELHTRIAMIRHEEVDQKPLLLGGMIIASSFVIFFGGNYMDAFVGSFFGLLIVYMQDKVAPICANTVVFNLLASFVSGTGTLLIAKVMPYLHPDKIMIGEIMILIPGIAITNAIRDVLVGDTISGFLRLIESVLFATAMACGYLLAIMLVGGGVL